MVAATGIIAGLGLFKTMLDTARGLKDMNDASIRNAASIQLQEQILAAQAAQADLMETVQNQRREIESFNKWEQERSRYVLEELPPGVFVFGLLPDKRNGEPDHKLCPNCFQQGKKSILMRAAPHNGRTQWTCHACKFSEMTGYFQQTNTVRTSRSDGW